MMAIMERSGEEVPKEFLETGRTGRRNAMPDILQPAGASLTTADLPLRLQRVTIVTPDKDAQAGPSKTDFSAQKDDSPAEPKGCS
ncbi:hypothetical protein JYU34_011143 [Plutella xylostella]|uniref:Uncharacterized protein n=3 Tax=Plutella xylostella TaxID=51655 RepID=A0ABQ7QGL8_PLUXY|nr:hypothetical protein JYU34_011143 [Plutella xylostella]CAG9110965.1 unnamed protein product [Plutella xylostella]